MADTIDHDHGSTGAQPPDGLNFGTGDFPDPEMFDWFWDQTVTAVNNHANQLNAIDSDGDGTVDQAEVADSATSYKGNDIDSDGDGKVDAADTADTADDGVPVGGIVMWSGSSTSVPSGWTLCDGTDPRTNSSSVPDLRNRFIVGSGDKYTTDQTGGSAEVTLTEAEMPSHAHTEQVRDRLSSNDAGGTTTEDFYSDSSTSSTQTSTEGGDEPHENRPPFYALAFIYKL